MGCLFCWAVGTVEHRVIPNAALQLREHDKPFSFY